MANAIPPSSRMDMSITESNNIFLDISKPRDGSAARDMNLDPDTIAARDRLSVREAKAQPWTMTSTELYRRE